MHDPLLAYWAQCVQQLPGTACKIKCDVLPAAWPLYQIQEITCLTDNIQCWSMLGKFKLVLSAIKSAVPFMSVNLVYLINSTCKKFQGKELLCILGFFLILVSAMIILFQPEKLGNVTNRSRQAMYSSKVQHKKI